MGEVEIAGQGRYAGETYRIWLKNEHMISWRNGQVDVTVPDLICIFDDRTLEPVINPYLAPGQAITVIGLPAPAEWRTPRGLEIFGPRHFGYDIAYTPLEAKPR